MLGFYCRFYFSKSRLQLFLICLLFIVPLVHARKVQRQREIRWQLLAGSVTDVSKDRRWFEVAIRSGASSTLQRWIEQNKFSISDAKPQLLVGMPQKVKVTVTPTSKMWLAIDDSLKRSDVRNIDVGSTLVFDLQPGELWMPEKSAITAQNIILQEACIEESCRKEKCKGASDCKDKVCACQRKK